MHTETVTPSAPVARDENDDLSTVAAFLMDAVSRHEITVSDAEHAVLEWARDADVLDVAARLSNRPDAVALLQLASNAARAA